MSIDDRVGKIESNINELEKEVATVKAHVTNHLPHMIADVRTDIASLEKKIKPLETKNLKSQGVHEFLNLALKGVTLLAAVIWTGLQICDKMNWFGM